MNDIVIENWHIICKGKTYKKKEKIVKIGHPVFHIIRLYVCLGKIFSIVWMSFSFAF